MTILGGKRPTRKRSKGPIILVILGVLIIAGIYGLYSLGGEQPLERIETPMAIPGSAS